jgi:cyclopropane fatty-acyl-phospholipid synthase-like methyltransferase
VPERPEVVDHYGAHYRDFAAGVYEQVRREAFGQDVGQNSWLTMEELQRFGSWLELGPSARLLDVGCGSGGPALHLARLTDCQVVGVELYEEAVRNGNEMARAAGLDTRASFVQADASRPLQFASASFDAIVCIDAINHLSGRPSILADWARMLRPGARLLFTDPVTVTGVLGSDEIAVRTSIGYFLFVPRGENDRLLTEVGLGVLAVQDTTEHLAQVARRRADARAKHREALRQTEGDEAFEGRQRFFDMVATLARERRLSRLVYVAEKPA